MNPEWIGIGFTVLCSFIGGGINYGILKSKIDRLEKDLDRAREQMVTAPLLHALLEPLRSDIGELKHDVREMLGALGKKE